MIYVIVVFLGLIFGSFNSVLISRVSSFIESDEYDWGSIVYGRSKCQKCGYKLKWYNLIPVLSYILQKGRCTQCRVKYGSFYMWVELITSFLFFIVFVLGGFGSLGWDLFLTLAIVNIGIVIAGVDFKTKFIQVYFSLCLGVLCLLYGFFVSELDVWQILTGGLIGYSFFGLQYLLSKGKWVGLGDADLGLCIGFMFGPMVAIYTILQSYILGTLVLVPLMVFAKSKFNMKSEIPFGPFLIFSMFISILFGRMIVDWYFINYIII